MGPGTATAGTNGFPVDTLYPIVVSRVVKGRAVVGPSVSVRVHGGQVGPDLFTATEGEPNLQVGERALFFLVRQTDGSFRPLVVIPSEIQIQYNTVHNPLFDQDPASIPASATPNGRL